MYKAVIKKPYNPNGRTQGKQNQLNKTNFIGTAVDFLRMSGLTHYQPPVAVALGWMLQSGRWILSPIFVQERKGDALINEAKVEALRRKAQEEEEKLCTFRPRCVWCAASARAVRVQ